MRLEDFIEEASECESIEEVQELTCPFCGSPLAVEEYPLDEYFNDDGMYEITDLFSCSDLRDCRFEFQYTRVFLDDSLEKLDHVDVGGIVEPY